MMDLLNNFTLITYLSDVVIKSFFLLTLSMILLRFIPDTSSKLRYRLLLLTFAGLAILPIQSLLPNTKLDVFAFQKDIAKKTQPAYLKALEPSAPKENIRLKSRITQPLHPIVASSSSSPSPYLLYWPIAMVLIWILIGLTLLLKNILEMIDWRRFVRAHQYKTPNEWEKIKKKAANELKLIKYPPIICSSVISSPLTYGWLHPVVVLPQIAHHWAVDRIKVVLLHEGIHIKRGDYFFNHLVNIALAMHWFNPLAWILSQNIRLECERSCDEKVVSLGISRTTYATELLAIAGQHASSRTKHNAITGLSVAHGSLLRQRFQTLLYPSSLSFQSGPLFFAGILIIALMFSFLRFQTPLPFFFSPENQLIHQIKKGSNPYTPLLLLTLVERDAKNSSRAILPLLSDKDPAVRAMAAWSLGQLRSKEAVTSLTRQISDANEEVKEHVLLSLGEFGYSNTFYSILPLLEHPNPDLRKAALWALSQIGCLPAFYHTNLYLNDPDPTVSKLAALLIDQWDRDKLYQWMAAYLQLSSIPSLCTESLEGIIQLDQVDQLAACLAPQNTVLQEQLKAVLSLKENDLRLDGLKHIFSKF